MVCAFARMFDEGYTPAGNQKLMTDGLLRALPVDQSQYPFKPKEY